jgi:hypothetical protein
MSLRPAVSSVVGVAALAVVTLQAVGVSRQEADSLTRKINAIAQQGGLTPSGTQGRSAPAVAARRTPVSESELNSWFAFKASPYLPAGVTRPTVTIVGDGAMIGGAVVDLDAVAKGRRGSLDPLSFLGGKLPVTITAKLSTKDGQGRLEMQSAEISGVPVPSALVEELIAYYARSSERPEGLRLGEAFDLPANIRQIEVTRGQLTVVQ